MQHSILDRIYIAFLAILIVSFGILIVFTSMMTRRSLIAEKTETLSNEASLIAQQTILGYLTGRYSEQDLVSLFDYYSSSLNADVWYVDEYGRVVATSQASQEENEEDGSERTKVQKKPELDIPYNIYQLAPDYNITTSHSEIGDFYGLYPQEMISVSMPVHVDILDGNRQITRTVSHGSIIILATASQINEQLRNIFSIVLIPCLVIIVIAFIFLAVVSRKVLTPVKRLSQVANEYSKGNLEVDRHHFSG